MTYWEMLDRLVLAASSLIVDHRRTADRLRITTSHSISRFARMRMADERLRPSDLAVFIDHKIERRRLLDRHVGGLGAF